MHMTAYERNPSAFKSVYGSPLFEDDREPISEIPWPTMASDIDRNPVSEAPRPTTSVLDDDIGVPALSLSPDRESSPEPIPRVRFDVEPRDFDYPDSDLDLTPTKLKRATGTKKKSNNNISCRTLRLSPSEDQMYARDSECKTANLTTKRPSGPVCTITQRNDLSVPVPNFKRGIKVPFSSLGPLVSAPDPPRQYTVYDHTLGVTIQKQLQPCKQAPNKGNKPVVSKVLGLQKRAYSQRSPMKRAIQRYTNYGTASCAFKYNKPEFHSTLKLARAMKTLQVSKVDTQEEMKKLMKEEDLATKIMQKASLPVNIPFTETQYKDLTPVDVATGEVVTKLLQDQEARMKSLQPSPRPKDHAPDLMEFYDDSIYHESPSWATYFPPVSLDFAVSAPSDCAYSQYRRLRMWENDD